jgi:hypothetical protein
MDDGADDHCRGQMFLGSDAERWAPARRLIANLTVAQSCHGIGPTPFPYVEFQRTNLPFDSSSSTFSTIARST